MDESNLITNPSIEASYEALHKRLEKEWERRLDRSLTQWRSDADKALDRSLKALMETMAYHLAGQFRETTLGKALTGSAAANSQVLGQQIDGLAGRMLAATLADLIGDNSIKRVTRESGRSQEAVSRFAQSRGQSKAQKAREIAKGQRNL